MPEVSAEVLGSDSVLICADAGADGLDGVGGVDVGGVGVGVGVAGGIVGDGNGGRG